MADLEVREGKNFKIKDMYIPIYEKINLTVEEAAVYSNIGINKINRMLDEPGCTFILQVGKGKRLVKRKEFEKYLLKTLDITDI